MSGEEKPCRDHIVSTSDNPLCASKTTARLHSVETPGPTDKARFSFDEGGPPAPINRSRGPLSPDPVMRERVNKPQKDLDVAV